jgi:hypothetical protein
MTVTRALDGVKDLQRPTQTPLPWQ